MNTVIRFTWLFIFVFSSAGAKTPESDAAESQIIIAKLEAARSSLSYKVIGRAPIENFYEVQVENGPILYVSKDGNYFFDGSLYQVKVGQFVDARSLRMNDEREAIFGSLSVDDMIVFKSNGTTQGIINVFTDVDCGFCRKLHKEVPQLNKMGIEVRYLAFPRAGIPSDAYTKIATAWCSDDPQGSLTRSKNGQDDVPAVCDNNPVAEHYELGQKLGVTGTPAIVLMDGSLIPGYKKAEEIAKILGIKS
ncbi:MAG TPA: protein-disulfide isomerase [Porticoccaceae bacterium]|jgi:thiol:disulfide interchange protein DsbC|nr:protein-disulfide isomerase [Porticoccaceae bacterium]